jgi:hypothetical protein
MEVYNTISCRNKLSRVVLLDKIEVAYKINKLSVFMVPECAVPCLQERVPETTHEEDQ